MKEPKILVTDVDPMLQDMLKPKLNDLKELGLTFKIASCKNEHEVIREGKNSTILIVTYAPITNQVLNKLNNLRLILKLTVGVDNIEIEEATKNRVLIVNSPKYCLEEVSTHAAMFLLALARQTIHYNSLVKSGKWRRELGVPVHRLKDKTLGVIGFGRIGRRFIQKIKPFRMRLLIYDPYIPKDQIQKRGAKKVTLPKLISNSDYISIHCPLNNETYHLIGIDECKDFKNGVSIINVSRAEIIDPTALLKGIKANIIQGVALDGYYSEPPKDRSLLKLERVICTPHSAWYSEEAREDVVNSAINEIKRFIRGNWPRNLVNKDLKDNDEINL